MIQYSPLCIVNCKQGSYIDAKYLYTVCGVYRSRQSVVSVLVCPCTHGHTKIYKIRSYNMQYMQTIGEAEVDKEAAIGCFKG